MMKTIANRAFAYLTIVLSTIACMGYNEIEPDYPAPVLLSISATHKSNLTYQLSASIDSKRGTSDIQSCGFYVSTKASMANAIKCIGTLSGNNVTLSLTVDSYGTTYYYRAFVSNGNSEITSGIDFFSSRTKVFIDLSSSETSNCYLVSSNGDWKFKATVKGNSNESVGSPVTAEVLWESFGTTNKPNVGDIVSEVSYSNGYICFTSGRDGNAVIAVKDASGTILWSWHIWVCQGFDPGKTVQEYNNNAGKMMDRNLGALSATPGNVGALGLLYQWGRKDPFLSGQALTSSVQAASTASWPNAVPSNANSGTISYSISHPTTFIAQNDINFDWNYTGSSYFDNTRWQSSKTKYDPCPPGYRIPEGGPDGIWSTAFGTSSPWEDISNWDAANRGMNFGTTDKRLGSGTIWYPAAGYRNMDNGVLGSVGNYGYYWSYPSEYSLGYFLRLNFDGLINPVSTSNRAIALSVRCLSESSAPVVPVTSVSMNKNSMTLAPGNTGQLKGTVLPSDASNKSLTWSSSNSGIATVSSDGLVTAVSAGNCTISATAYNGINAECDVTVTDKTYSDLSSAGTANCYIVKSQGNWKFKATVKGNSNESVGSTAKAEVLWESFGTSTKPNVGEIISNVSYFNGYVNFTSGRDGNAVIAVKDASGTILWSWHIWVCQGFDPDKTVQEYNNNAGKMMDRNLGALSATPGNVGALGLLYQWGRKDPFPGAASTTISSQAVSTVSWPSKVPSDASNGTIAYAVSHPTTFIYQNNGNLDWYYSGSTSTDNTRWQSTKTKYDPCPPGYRVPDGGKNGVWSTAFSSASYYSNGPWKNESKGMDFGSGNGHSSNHQLGSASLIWYPAAGYFNSYYSLDYTGTRAGYWSCTSSGYYACSFFLYDYGRVTPSDDDYRACALSVRCLSESSAPVVPVTSVSMNKNSMTLAPGNTGQLKGTVLPSDASNKSLTWSSSNSGIATVSSDGLVTAVSAGNCTICATATNGESAYCTISISDYSHDYVDLGLSVKWAKYNVGATKPEEMGSRFSWGEIMPKNNYSWDYYKWGSSGNFTKYNYSDKRTVLEPADDAAYVNWGGGWRMPTKTEAKELIDKCTWTSETVNGVSGYRVTSRINGNSIFLPVCGQQQSSSSDIMWSTHVMIWTSTTDGSSYAYRLAWGNSLYDVNNTNQRHDGLCVRAVVAE